MNSMTPGGGAARVTSTPEASTVRGTTSGPPSPLSDTSCQDVSPGAGSAVRGAGAEGAGAGAGGDEPFGGELGDGAGDGDGADPEPFDESPARRELSTR